MNKIRCIIDVGHSEQSQGAANKKTGITEWQFNSKLASDIQNKFSTNQNNIEIVITGRSKDIKTISDLVNTIEDLEPDFVISLHCNAFNEKASGFEVLIDSEEIADGQKEDLEMADILISHLGMVIPIKNRGIKKLKKQDRGGYQLYHMLDSNVIVESFFIDNDSDLKIVQENYITLVSALSNSIIEIAKRLFSENFIQSENFIRNDDNEDSTDYDVTIANIELGIDEIVVTIKNIENKIQTLKNQIKKLKDMKR